MRFLRYFLISCCLLLTGITPVFAEVVISQDNGSYILENAFVRLRVNPARGGKVEQYLVKATGKDLLGKGLFLLGDHFWQQPWPGEMLDAPYEARVQAQTATSATLEVSRTAGVWNGSNAQSDLRIIRRMTLTDDSPLLSVEIAIENVGKVGRLAGYWSQSVLYPGGDRDDTRVVFRPATRGVSMSLFDAKSGRFSFTAEEPGDGFVQDPQGAWMATLGAKAHSGLAFVMRYDELMYLYNCMPDTNEWQYKATGIPVGKTWKTDFVVYPITLPRVDYACRSFAAAIEPHNANGTMTVQCRFVAAGTALDGMTVTPSMALVRQGKEFTPLTVQQLGHVDAGGAACTLTTQHQPADPVVLRFRVQGTQNGTPVDETFETWYGADYGVNRQVDNTPLYPIPAPPRHVTFLKPDVITKTVNAQPRVLFGKGMYFDYYLTPSLFQPLNAEVVSSYYQPAGQWPASLSTFPASYDDLMALDIIALINVDSAALGDAGLEMLRDFIKHGGTLVYGGDQWAYSRGNVKGTALAELLPVTFTGDSKTPGALQAVRGKPVYRVIDGKPGGMLAKDAVLEYWSETFCVKPGAHVLLACDGKPVLVDWTVGQGHVVAITGTALGDPAKGRALSRVPPNGMPSWPTCCVETRIPDQHRDYDRLYSDHEPLIWSANLVVS